MTLEEYLKDNIGKEFVALYNGTTFYFYPVDGGTTVDLIAIGDWVRLHKRVSYPDALRVETVSMVSNSQFTFYLSNGDRVNGEDLRSATHNEIFEALIRGHAQDLIKYVLDNELYDELTKYLKDKKYRK